MNKPKTDETILDLIQDSFDDLSALYEKAEDMIQAKTKDPDEQAVYRQLAHKILANSVSE